MEGVLEDLKVRLPAADMVLLRGRAESRETSVAAEIRLAVSEYLARREGDRAVPIIDAAFAKHVDRLAALIAKTFVAAAAGTWQTNYLIHRLCKGEPGAKESLDDVQMRLSVLRALVDLRRHGAEMGMAPEEEYRDSLRGRGIKFGGDPE